MWLNKLKIAIVKKDADSINILLNSIEEFQTNRDEKEIQEAIYLLKEASELIYSLKNEALVSMNHIKKSIDFLHSVDMRNSKELDIRL